MRTNVVGFNYASLKRHGEWLQGEATEIRGLVRQSTRSIVEIGQRLTKIRERIGPRAFREWCGAEFRWRLDLAGQYMAVAKVFDAKDLVEQFQPSALFVLARRSVPEKARAKAIAEARSGKPISRKRALELISEDTVPGSRKPIATVALWRLRSSLRDAEGAS